MSGLELHRVHAGYATFEAVLGDLMVKPRDVAGIDGDDAAALAELAAVQHRRFSERHHRNADGRARLVKTRVLKMSDHECIVALALGAHRVADHFTRTPHLDQGMGIGIVRRNALDIDRRARIDHRLEMLAQAVPIGLAVLVVDIALVPNAHVQLPYNEPRSARARSKTPCSRKRHDARRLPAYAETLKLKQL